MMRLEDKGLSPEPLGLSEFSVNSVGTREYSDDWIPEVIAMRRRWIWFVAGIVVLGLFATSASGAEKVLKMSTTTSTENSGLLDLLLPEFTKESGIQVKVFAKGTGAAIRDGMDGNVDITVLFLHPEGLGTWYLSIGQGMGKTLTYAEEKQAYTMTDRGTYLKYKLGRKQGLDLEILCEGDERLFNPYGIIPINPKMYPHVKFDWADTLAKWLVSPKAQALIAEYRIQGQQAFFPDAFAYAK
ncbi:MAG: hypothetical protein P8X67_21000 [Syntrophobacterales bacterium]